MSADFIRILGPARHNPGEGGVAGVDWFIPFIDSEHLAGRLLWYALDKFSSRERAIQQREAMLSEEGVYGIDDWNTFLAVCKLIRSIPGNQKDG